LVGKEGDPTVDAKRLVVIIMQIVVRGVTMPSGLLNALSPNSAGIAGASGASGASSGAASTVSAMLAQGTAALSSGGFFGANPTQIQAIVASLNSGNMEAMQGAVNAMINLANGGKTPATAGSNTLVGGKTSGSNGNTVNIEVKIPEVTEAEASKFAKLVKQYLTNDTLTSNMGSY
jgi:hypothetical protein